MTPQEQEAMLRNYRRHKQRAELEQCENIHATRLPDEDALISELTKLGLRPPMVKRLSVMSGLCAMMAGQVAGLKEDDCCRIGASIVDATVASIKRQVRMGGKVDAHADAEN